MDEKNQEFSYKPSHVISGNFLDSHSPQGKLMNKSMTNLQRSEVRITVVFVINKICSLRDQNEVDKNSFRI